MSRLKKNLAELLKKEPDWEPFFFDESRFGTHSKRGYGWFPKGTRPRIATKLGFQNFYLYAAVSPVSGECHSLILPFVNGTCMNSYLHDLSQTLGTRKVLLIMDGAGWHKAKHLALPHNIRLRYLPPYSPELNPVERLWQYIKDRTIKNKIFSDLKQLEDSLCHFLSTLTPSEIISITTCQYLYN